MKTKLHIATCLTLAVYGFMPPAFAQTATVEFASPTYTVNRFGGQATITLIRSAAVANDEASVVVYVTGGTATFNEDYLGLLPNFDPHAQRISFFGTTNAAFQIAAIANHKPDATIVLSLTSPHGVTLGRQTNATVSIVNSGPAVSFREGWDYGTFEQNVSENEKFTIVTVHNLGGTNLPFSVDYATRDGTAKAGVDYTLAAGTLAFAVGETDKLISIPLSADDGLVGGDKTFRVCLTNATGGASILGRDATVIIQDSEVPANLDYSFQPFIRGGSRWRGPDNLDWDGQIQDLAILPNGKVLIAGWFTRVNEAESIGLACLNADGSVAPAFHPRLARQDSYPADVRHIAALPDGRVYVTGNFESVNGILCPTFARLLPDGSLDESFAPSISPTAWRNIATIVVQPDGRVIANTDSGLVRLNETGSRDFSFVSALGTNSRIAAFVEHTDGKLLVVDFDGQMTRLNTNGARDDSFQKVSLDNPDVSLLVQIDHKILVAGSFTSINGLFRRNLVRLNADGSPDLAFVLDAGDAVFNSRAIALAESGKILMLGWDNCWRLNADGSLDSRFPGFHYEHLDESVEDLCCSDRGIKAARDFAYVWGYPLSAIDGSRVHGLGRIFLNENPRTGIGIQSAHAHDPPDWFYTGADYLQAAGEGEGVLRVKVRRLGQTIGPASVTFATRDGTAIAGRDFLSTNVTLSFAPLEKEKIVTVPILHNATYDGPRTLELFLTNAVGAEFLAPPLIMTILDQEPAFEPGAITRGQDGSAILLVRDISGTANLEVSNDLKTWEYLAGPLGRSFLKQTYYDFDARNFPQRFYRLHRID